MVHGSHLDGSGLQMYVFLQRQYESWYSYSFAGLYPKRMFINRGNHETKDMNRTYGFEGEAKHKHGEQTYKVCLSWLSPLCLTHAHRHATSCSRNCSQLVRKQGAEIVDTADRISSASLHDDLCDEATGRQQSSNPFSRRQEAILCRARRSV